MQPVFVMGSEHSGGELARRLLGGHPELAAPHPVDLWTALHPLVASYGPLDEEGRWRELLDDALALCRAVWPAVPEADEVARRIVTTNLSGVAGALHETCAARAGARAWLCSERDLAPHALRIVDVYPEARVVYLARDGRDVVAVRRAAAAPRSVAELARSWRDEQRAAIDAFLDLAPSGRCRLLRYEELVDAPEQVLRVLCEWIGLDFDERMLDFREPHGSTAHWGAFRTALAPDELAEVEALAGDELRRLGYPLEATGAVRARRWFPGQWFLDRRARRARRRGRPAERDDAFTGALRALRRRREAVQAPPLAPALERELAP